MGELSLENILFIIGPSSGNPLWNILLYIIFFLALITLFSLPDKNLTATLLMAAVLICAAVAKISLSSPDPILSKREFGMLAINALMFTFPFITMGVTRKARITKAPKSTIPALFCGLMAGVYFFGYWFVEQRPYGLVT